MFTLNRIIFLASTAIFLLFVSLFWDYAIDDAFITFRYSENLANGHGLVFNPGDKPIEGYSNFLWLLFLSLLYKLGLPTYVTAKLMGLSSFLLSAIIWFRHFEKDGAKLSWLVGPLFLICPITAFWGLSGLELGLYTLLISGATIALLRRSAWLHILLLLIVLSRPEGIAVGCGLLVIGALSDFLNSRLDKRYFATGIAVLAVTFLGLTLFRLQVFGLPLPNTYYAKKHHNLTLGYLELRRMFLIFAPFTIGLLWGIVRLIARKAADKEMALYVILFAMQTLISVRVDPVTNFHFRYLVPFLPFLLAVSLIATSHLGKVAYRWLAVCAFLISLFLPLPKVNASVQLERERTMAQQAFIKWTKSLPENATISMSDMGRIPYYTGNTYYDIYGLVDQETALQGFSPEREFMRLPDYFVLVGYVKYVKTFPEELHVRVKLRYLREQLITSIEAFFSTYELKKICLPPGADPQNPGYYYLVFIRNNVNFFYDLDLLSLLRERLDLAEKYALRILEIVPDDIKAYHLLGSIYTEQKNYEKAKKVWEDILAFSPEDSVAIQNLKQLETRIKK